LCPASGGFFVVDTKHWQINQQTKGNTMKTKMTAVCATLLLATAVSFAAGAESATSKAGSPEFERMKALVGSWHGTADMGQGPVDMTVQYRLLAGGSVLEERCFIGTPHEMVSMYYDQNGKLAMTHYCVMGNRPGMLLKSSDTKTIRFAFDKTCGINPKKESHMHALTISFDDADTITTRCKAIMDGKEMPDHPTTLKRVAK
jgi:hypothetical protein